MQQSEVALLRTPIICYLLIEKSLVTTKGPGRSLPSAKHERAEIVQINLTSLTSSMSTRKMLYRARISSPIELPANRNCGVMFLFETRACRLDDGKQREEEEMLLLRALHFTFP